MNSIKKTCKAADQRGLKQVYLFYPHQLLSVTEHQLYPTSKNLSLKAGEKYCQLDFDKMKGSFSEPMNFDETHGNYYQFTVTVTISFSRIEVDALLARLHNRPVHAIVQDYAGVWRFVRFLTTTADHNIEKGNNGYVLKFSGKSAKKSHILDGTITTESTPNLTDIIFIDKDGGKWRVYITTRGELVQVPTTDSGGQYSYPVTLTSDFYI